MPIRNALTLCVLWGAICLIPSEAQAQIGGQYVFESLRLSGGARTTALGGVNISLRDNDAFTAFNSPALLHDSLHQQAVFSGVSFLGGIGYGTAGYVHHVNNVGTFFGGVQYMGYGKFTRADALGVQQGEFTANDIGLNLAAARSFGRFNVGFGTKLLYSQMDAYSAWGLAFDLGGLYYWAEQDFGVGLQLKNFGTMLSTYMPDDDRAPLPFEIQFGVSKRIPHTPMRFHLQLHNLQTPRMAYTDVLNKPQLDLNGNPIDNSPKTADQIFRHVTFGLEFLFGKYVQIDFAYNHQRRREFRLPDQNFSLDGFTLGAGVHVRKFQIHYGFARYFKQGAVHHFSVGVNIGAWRNGASAPTAN